MVVPGLILKLQSSDRWCCWLKLQSMYIPGNLLKIFSLAVPYRGRPRIIYLSAQNTLAGSGPIRVDWMIMYTRDVCSILHVQADIIQLKCWEKIIVGKFHHPTENLLRHILSVPMLGTCAMAMGYRDILRMVGRNGFVYCGFPLIRALSPSLPSLPQSTPPPAFLHPLAWVCLLSGWPGRPIGDQVVYIEVSAVCCTWWGWC